MERDTRSWSTKIMTLWQTNAQPCKAQSTWDIKFEHWKNADPFSKKRTSLLLAFLLYSHYYHRIRPKRRKSILTFPNNKNTSKKAGVRIITGQ